MIIVDQVIVKEELLKVRFACNLAVCKGECCIEGDAGAPLDLDEIGVMEDVLEAVSEFLTPKGLEVIQSVGVFEYDAFGNFVTPLIDDQDCAFVRYENNIAICGIEKAFLKGKIKFRKPISCYLYPIRISHNAGMDTLHYHRWDICKSALSHGQQKQLPLYQFLRDPLIQKYGYSWYKKLEKLAKTHRSAETK